MSPLAFDSVSQKTAVMNATANRSWKTGKLKCFSSRLCLWHNWV